MKKELALILFLLTLLKSFAQISGKIVDTNNEPVIGVNIIIENTSIGTLSDIDGNYNLKNLKSGTYRIAASYIGFKTVKKTVTLKKENIILNFKLEEDAFTLNTVEIKGKTKAQIIREQSYAVETVEMKDLKNLSTDINAILGKVSGVNIRQSGGLGSDFSLSLNGFSGNQIRVFIDGIPMHYFGTSLTLNNFPSNLIEQIEVYKGVVPIHLSSDALGGAINVVTNKSQKSFLDASYSIGSFGTHRISLNAQRRSNSGFTARLKSFYNTSKNNYKVPIYLVDGNTGKPSENATEVERFHDGYNSKMIWGEIGFTGVKFADELMAGIMVSDNFKEIQQPINAIGEARFPYGEVDDTENNLITNLSFRKSNLLNNKLSITAYLVGVFSNGVFSDTSDYRYDWLGNRTFRSSFTGEIENRKTELKLKSTNVLGNINTEYTLNDNHSLIANYSFNRYKISGSDKFKKQNDTQFAEPNKLNKQVTALSYTNNFLDGNFKSSIFGKYYMYGINSIETNYSGTERSPLNKSLNHLGYGITASYKLNKFLLKASFENALRFPEDYELFGDGTSIRAQPALLPEKSNNYNLGFIFNNENTDKNLMFSVNTFLRDGKNYIFPQPVGVFIEYKNSKNAFTKGIDISASYNHNKTFLIAANGTFYDKRNTQKWTDESQTEPYILYKIRFPNEPYIFGNVSFSYKKDDLITTDDTFVATLRQNYVHKFFYKWSNLADPSEKAFVPKQYTNDLEFVYSLKEQTYNISFGINNLWDATVYDNFKQTKPGRSFSFKLRYFIN